MYSYVLFLLGDVVQLFQLVVPRNLYVCTKTGM